MFPGTFFILHAAECSCWSLFASSRTFWACIWRNLICSAISRSLLVAPAVTKSPACKTSQQKIYIYKCHQQLYRQTIIASQLYSQLNGSRLRIINKIISNFNKNLPMKKQTEIKIYVYNDTYVYY